ncbi:MAG TPA: replication initiator, partial [Propionibacteriaceae bacterium]|nr:replication initiator [Propionibacteriaceae bacterium]
MGSSAASELTQAAVSGDSELWRRTTIYLRRALAAAAGTIPAARHRTIRVAFVKVAEYQARGAIHFHAVIRLDAAPPTDDPDQVAAPPP